MRRRLFMDMSNASRLLNMKATVLSLYPELARLYKEPSGGCVKCGKNRRGRAILEYILGDVDLAKKDRKTLGLILPKHIMDKLGDHHGK